MPGSLIVTDGWQGYNRLPEIGYRHERKTPQTDGDHAHVLMPAFTVSPRC